MEILTFMGLGLPDLQLSELFVVNCTHTSSKVITELPSQAGIQFPQRPLWNRGGELPQHFSLSVDKIYSSFLR